MRTLSMILTIVALIGIGMIGRLRTTSHAQDVNPTPLSIRTRSFEKLIDTANRTGSVRVIVGLDEAFVPEGDMKRPNVSKQRNDIRAAQGEFLQRFRSFRIAGIKQFEYIPYVAIETDAAALQQMQNDPAITSIQEDEIADAGLAESTPIVGAPAAWASGYTGAGQTVAILDSGVDKNHLFLAGKVISEGCYSSNVAGSSSSFCPGGATESTAPNSGLHCPVSIDGCAHGTNVAGIAAGNGATFSGVAKGSNIIAIQMFSNFTCGGSPCARYWTSDLIRALERVMTLSGTMSNIAAVNLSLQTGQQFVSNCDTAHAATKAAIDNLRSVGIPTVICAGNFAFTNALTAPACISTSISVGSVDDGSLGTTLDTVSNFSDSSPLLHLLAPGRWINSSIPNNAFQNYSGTSMATPHIVGAFAVLRQREPNASVSRILNTLISTGQPITDSRNGIVKPRLRLDRALIAISRESLADFDADGKTDISVWRPADGNWHLSRSTDGYAAYSWGANGDRIVPADFDGDGKADVAVWRPADGTWHILNSDGGTYSTYTWGASGDAPVVGDYDDDGKADVAVYRSANASWHIRRSSDGGYTNVTWGVMGDVPVAGDFDGDGESDIAVRRPLSGEWFINRSTDGYISVRWGVSSDSVVHADYDGDGKDDVAVWRPSTGEWFILRSSDGGYTQATWGANGDVPVPGDYDGDGKADISVVRNGVWHISQSTAGYRTTTWGVGTDVAIPGRY